MKTKNTKTSETISETSFAYKVKQFFSKIFNSIKNFFSNVFTNTKSEQRTYTKNNPQQHFSTPTSSPLTVPNQEPLIFEKKTIQPKVLSTNNQQPLENEPISNIIINNENSELNIDTMLEPPTEPENQSPPTSQETTIWQEDIDTSDLFAEPNFDDINNAEPQEVPSNETPVESPTDYTPSPANSATSVAIKEENIKEENIKEENIKGEEKMVQEKIKVNSVEELKNAVLNCLEEKNINKVVYDAYTKTLSIKIPTEDRNDDKMEVQRMLVFKLDEMKPQIEVEIMPLSGRGAYTNEVFPANLKEMPSKYEAVFELLKDNKEFLAKELNIKKQSKQKSKSEADEILDEAENEKTHPKNKGPAWKQERKRIAREAAENEKKEARKVEEEMDKEENTSNPEKDNRSRHIRYDYSR